MANQKNVLLSVMNLKKARDYALMGGGFIAAGVSTVFVVAEIPAIIVGGAGVLVAASAMERLRKREEENNVL